MDPVGSPLAQYGLIGVIGHRAISLGGQEATLTSQATSGLVSPGVAGLGEVTGTVLDLQPQSVQLKAYVNNATLAGVRLQTAQTAMTSISSLAATLATSLTQLSTESGSSLTTAISSIAALARSALGGLPSILNTKSGDTYVFAGVDGTVAPVVDPSSVTTGALSSGIANAVSGLAANGVSATLASIVSAVSNNSIFSPDLSISPAPPAASIDVGFGQSAITGIPATSGQGMAAPSSTSTGSSVNDLVAVLSAVSSLSSLNAADPQLSALVSGLRTMLGGARTGLSAMTSTLGVSQQQVKAVTATNAALSDVLTSQMAGLTSVDLPTVATQLTETQNQLMASYEIISDLKGMSLAAYI